MKSLANVPQTKQGSTMHATKTKGQRTRVLSRMCGSTSDPNSSTRRSGASMGKTKPLAVLSLTAV
eukprot:2267111-Lingulodinium_polyedra.AAC.1